MQFYEKYLELCNSVGKSPSKVVLEIGLKKSAVTRWKSGGMPTDATAQKIADYFGVSVDYLLGEDKERKRPINMLQLFADEKEEPNTDGVELSEMEEKLLSLFRSVPADRQPFIIASIESALQLSGLFAVDGE